MAKVKPAKRRATVPVELSDSAKAIVDDFATTGMSRKTMVERLLVWFAGQDDVVRASILGTVPESLRVDAARIWMERYAAGGKSSKRAG